jgi:hypothetical protein
MPGFLMSSESWRLQSRPRNESRGPPMFLSLLALLRSQTQIFRSWTNLFLPDLRMLPEPMIIDSSLHMLHMGIISARTVSKRYSCNCSYRSPHSSNCSSYRSPQKYLTKIEGPGIPTGPFCSCRKRLPIYLPRFTRTS